MCPQILKNFFLKIYILIKYQSSYQIQISPVSQQALKRISTSIIGIEIEIKILKAVPGGIKIVKIIVSIKDTAKA
jgi:hypothetical protein